jgi:hypothetical protein
LVGGRGVRWDIRCRLCGAVRWGTEDGAGHIFDENRLAESFSARFRVISWSDVFTGRGDIKQQNGNVAKTRNAAMIAR